MTLGDISLFYVPKNIKLWQDTSLPHWYSDGY